MRIADDKQSLGLNDNGANVDIKKIKNAVSDFRDNITNDELLMKNVQYHKLVKQIDKYWQKLFADPIIVETTQGKITIQPQRTNNILERFFRDLKRNSLKKSGRNNMSKTLKAMIADTPLVKNLQKPQYLEILLNGYNTLEERFAEIDAELVRNDMKRIEDDLEKIPPKIQKIIKNDKLPQTIVKMCRNYLYNCKSN